MTLSADRKTLTQREQQYLSALRYVADLASRLDTTCYVWGGMATSIHLGYFYRRHHDIDLMIHHLHHFVPQLAAAFERNGWHVDILLNNHLLVVKKGDVKLHVNNVVTEGNKAVLKHFGEDGGIVFPRIWLSSTPVSFFDTSIFVVAPSLLYVLKNTPSLFDPAYDMWSDQKRAKRASRDVRDIESLRRLLVKKSVEVDTLSILVTCHGDI